MHISQSTALSPRIRDKSKSRTSSVERDPTPSTSQRAAKSSFPRMSRMSSPLTVSTTPNFPLLAPELCKSARSEEKMRENSWMVSSFPRRLLPSQRRSDQFDMNIHFIAEDLLGCPDRSEVTTALLGF